MCFHCDHVASEELLFHLTDSINTSKYNFKVLNIYIYFFLHYEIASQCHFSYWVCRVI